VISIITRIVQERNAWFRCHKKKVKGRGFGRKLGIYFLAGVFNPSEKYDFVSWDDYSQYMDK
jgi:hypothetical protein